MAAALLVLLLAAAASAASLAEAGYVASDVHLASNLCVQPHTELFDALHRTMGDAMPRYEFGGHRFLSDKDADAEERSPPARTIKLHLSGCSDEDRVTLALSDADAGVLAYADAAGLWHAFPGFEFMFPNSTTLPFNASYDHLIGGHRNLPMAIQELSRPGTAAAAALVRLMAMTSEALLWKAIREAFGQRWESESFVTKEQAELVPHWVDLSYLVWRWEVTGAWEGESAGAKALEKIGIYNGAQALSVVDLLKRPKELCVGDGHGELDLAEEDGEMEEDDESTITEEAGEGGAAAALHRNI
nr:unnamed protein product [Digitaria exilis]